MTHKHCNRHIEISRIFVYVQFKNIFFKLSLLKLCFEVSLFKMRFVSLSQLNKVFLFWISVVPLESTGCEGDTFTCLGDNVVCSTNTCECAEGYRVLSGECVPSKSLFLKFILLYKRVFAFNIYIYSVSVASLINQPHIFTI